MTAHFPEDESEEAQEGTAAHELAAALIHSHGRPLENLTIGLPASNGTIITDEIFDGAEVYADDVLAALPAHDVFAIGRARLSVEATGATGIHPAVWGTRDASLQLRHRRRLIVWDFKFGHAVVEPFENWQLICYALCELLSLAWPRDWAVELRVVQPRAYHRDGVIRTWGTTSAQLIDVYFSQLQRAAVECLQPNAPVRSGTHCRYCPARHACEAAIDAGVQLYEVIRQPVPVDMSNRDLGAYLHLVQRARAQLDFLETAIAERVTGKIRAGETVPGYALQPGRGRTRWVKPAAEVLRIGRLLGVDLAKPSEPITPNQASKAGLDPAVLAASTERTATGLALVSVQDQARRIFST
jgi:hypothetical protein